MQLQNLTRELSKRLQVNTEAANSGVIINTSGYIEGVGYDMLLFTIDIMEIDFVLVLDNERLFSDLNKLYGSKIKVLKLPKSGGVVTRSAQVRRQIKNNKIREYFYGPTGDLCPHSTVVEFKDIIIFRVGGGPAAPASALPIGFAPTVDPVQLTEIQLAPEMTHSIFGVSHATSPEGILESNIAGFLYVQEINFIKSTITFLAPCPGPLPGKYLIMSTIKWLE